MEDFSKEAQDRIDGLIGERFPDAIAELESFFGRRTGGLTRNQVIWFEQYWRAYGPRTPEREVWEALKRTHERQKVTSRPSSRKEVIVIKGHRVAVWRDLATGRFVRRRRKR